MDGVEQLICCSVEGEISGYKAMPANMLDLMSERDINQESIRDMAQRKQVAKIKRSILLLFFFYSLIYTHLQKQNLMLELDNLQEASKPSVERKFDEFGEQSTGIPANTQVYSNLSTHSPTETRRVLILTESFCPNK
jgi:Bardet-Biedl syndrome 2 protein